MNAAPTVSVVIATHNGRRYITEQIESIAAQTFPPVELILSDDASTDNTVDLALEAASRCPFETRLIRNPKALGFRDNFLQAALQAKGHFIAFCDQDDVWRPTKLERCSKYFDEQSVVLIVHSALLIDQSANPVGEFRQGIRRTGIKAPLSYDPWGTFWGFSMTFRRDILELLDVRERFIDYIAPAERIAHDRWVTFLSQMVGATAEIDEPLVYYRQHGGNLFGARSNKSAFANDLVARSRTYIEATSQMLELIGRVPANATSRFPLFDKVRCTSFLTRALRQLEKRHAIYEARGKGEAVGRLFASFVGGYYAGVHDGGTRWKSVLRDTKFALMGS